MRTIDNSANVTDNRDSLENNINEAVHDCLRNRVNLSFTEDSPSSKLKIGEKAKFKVQVLNTTPLNLTNVVIQVVGNTYVEVSADGLRWGSSADATAISVDRDAVQETNYFYLKLKDVNDKVNDIDIVVTARLVSCDASFINIHIHSTTDHSESKLKKEILSRA